jgi:hypothetical protein
MIHTKKIKIVLIMYGLYKSSTRGYLEDIGGILEKGKVMFELVFAKIVHKRAGGRARP